MKTKETSVWKEPKKKDSHKAAFDKGLPTEVKRPASQFQEKPDDLDAREEILARGRRELDKLTLALGQESYISKPRFGWLKENIRGLDYPLTVDRYYLKLKLLIDNRVDKSPDLKRELKKKLAEANGFQYFHIQTEEELQRMFAMAVRQ